MRNVKVQKPRLLRTLHENRESHVADFDIAWEAFREKAQENMEAILDRLRSAGHGEEVQLWVGLQPPENHAEDYDRAIEMVDWEVGDELVLTEQEFQNYVQDEWHWKGAFAQSNVEYTGSTSPSKMGGVKV